MMSRHYRNSLPINHQFHDYRIQSILGESYFSITYLAEDTKQNCLVVLKEYFPNQIAFRLENQQVQPAQKNKALFQFGLEEFMKEGKALIDLKHPNIVSILDVFQAHNTVYWVMTYETGQNLASLLEKQGTLTQAKLMTILPPLLAALTAAHQAGFLHLNIIPNNIYLRENDYAPVLLDFGAARYAFACRHQQPHQANRPHYTAFEQYHSGKNQGAWTDIYALGAVLYHAISGKMPVDSLKRGKLLKLQGCSDPLSPAIKMGESRYPKNILQAIDWALQIVETERPQKVAQWEEAMFSGGNKKLNQQAKLLAATKRITIATTLVIFISSLIGLAYLYKIKWHLGQVEEQQILLENQRLKEAALEHERLEEERKRARAHFLTLLQQPAYIRLPEIEQPLSLPNQAIQSLQGHEEGICVDGCLAFSPDGQSLASGSWDNTIKLWAVKTGSLQQTFEGHDDLVLSIAFSLNGLFLVSGSADNTIKIWEVSTGKLLQTIEETNSWVGAIALSPNGQLLAAEGANNTVKLWALNTGKIVHTLTGHQNIINSVSFSPEGQHLASASADKTIKIWSVKTGQLLKTLTGHQKQVLSVAFSPDGKTLASSSVDRTIKVWDIADQRLQYTLKAHNNWVVSVIFSPDGRYITSSSYDQTIRFWDREKGKLLQTLTGHNNHVNSIAFSPDGRLFASGSRDLTIKIWQ
jgi:Tol biopolymer transport system component